jgi:hypothetical protein
MDLLMVKPRSAVSIRARARESTVDQEKNAIKNYFKYQNKIATGEYKKDDPKALIDTYGYSATYQVKELLSFSKTGVIAISPIFGGGSSIGSYLYNTSTEDETFDIVCYSGKSSENLIFEFPKELKIISIPDNFELANDTLFYSAKYDLQNNVLTVSRVFDDKTKGNVCSAKTMKEYDDFIKKVKPNYDDQVIYKKM